MIRHKLNFKGQTLLYFKTNHGSLFSVRTLLSIIRKRYVNNESMARYVRPELCVLVKRGSQHGTLCTGLKGVRQLFADRPNKQLEELLLSNGIVKGEMPCAADVKVIEEPKFVTKEQVTLNIDGEKVFHVNRDDILVEWVTLHKNPYRTPYVIINGKKYYWLDAIEDNLFRDFVRDSTTPFYKFLNWSEAQDHYVNIIVHGLVNTYCNSEQHYDSSFDQNIFIDSQAIQFFICQSKQQLTVLEQLGVHDMKSEEIYDFVIQQQKQLLAAQQQIKYLEKKISVLEKLQGNTAL